MARFAGNQLIFFNGMGFAQKTMGMLIAVPIFRGRVAPRVDRRCQVIMLDWAVPGEPKILDRLAWTEESIFERARILKRQGVEMLICGALEAWVEESFRRQGIRVVPWVAASLENVLDSLSNGGVESIQGSSPGRRPS